MRRSTLSVFALALTAASAASAQSRVVLPAGSVVIVKTMSPLQSATAQAGQTFETEVVENIGVDEYTVIPAGSRIRGAITVARPATRQQSGVIEVVFNRLTLADGSAFAITGRLTSTDTAERRQINSDPNARVVLVGERGGIGAAIAGAGSSRNNNSLLTALGGLLSEGRDVNVAAGTPMAVELDNAVTLRSRGRHAADESTIYTGIERVRAAQTALTRLDYYSGPVNGRLDDATRRALFEFQVDRRLNGTGNLDGRTAEALGIGAGAGASASVGAVLSADASTMVRRDAQTALARLRSELGASSVGRLDASRTYAQADLELWFALSAFADNASVHEQVIRNGGNAEAAMFAGRSLVAAAKRVDAAMTSARTTTTLQGAWSSVRRQLATLETQ